MAVQLTDLDTCIVRADYHLGLVNVKLHELLQFDKDTEKLLHQLDNANLFLILVFLHKIENFVKVPDIKTEQLKLASTIADRINTVKKVQTKELSSKYNEEKLPLYVTFYMMKIMAHLVGEERLKSRNYNISRPSPHKGKASHYVYLANRLHERTIHIKLAWCYFTFSHYIFERQGWMLFGGPVWDSRIKESKKCKVKSIKDKRFLRNKEYYLVTLGIYHTEEEYLAAEALTKVFRNKVIVSDKVEKLTNLRFYFECK